MPTRLPGGRRFWRRYAPAPDTLRNIAATALEFAFALAFVAAAVIVLARADPDRLWFPRL